MTSTVEFINRWQRIALLSQSLLDLRSEVNGISYCNKRSPICKVLKR